MGQNKIANKTQSVEKVQMHGVVKVKLAECEENQ